MSHTPATRSRVGVTRLSVTAQLDPLGLGRQDAVRRAEEGDESWEEWSRRADRGDAATVLLRTRADFALPGREGHVTVVNEGVWLERCAHVPLLEEQVRDVAYKDAGPLSEGLRAEGLDVGRDVLLDMYFHVELPDSVLDALVPGVAMLVRSAR